MFQWVAITSQILINRTVTNKRNWIESMIRYLMQIMLPTVNSNLETKTTTEAEPG